MIKDNVKLKSLKFPIFMKYVTKRRATGSLVQLENNPELRKLIDFLPIPLLKTCGQQKRPGGCYYDEKVTTRQRVTSWSNLDIGNVVVAGVMSITIIVFTVFFCYKNHQSTKAHSE